jgi:periplasmic protein TonB
MASELRLRRVMRARLLSLGIHAGAILLLLAISRYPASPPGIRSFTRVVSVSKTGLIAPPLNRGGGGGGERNPLLASKGRLPRLALRQFLPPSAEPRDVQPRLAMEATLVAPPDLRLPEPDLARIGYPFGNDGPASNGPGTRGGIGAGDDGGIGNQRGPGYGPEDGGGVALIGGGGGITAPRVLYKVDPEFSEEARKAKYQGTVILTIEVGEDGRPHGFRIVRGLGLGLDEKAIEAVAQWKFRPAMRNGKPIRAPATIEVNFRLL